MKKKNYFDYSSSSDDDDIEEFVLERHAASEKDMALLKKMNIDSLLRDRQMETLMTSSQNSQDVKSNKKTNDILKKMNEIAETEDSIDGSIFNVKNIKYPTEILKIIENISKFGKFSTKKLELVEEWVFTATLKAPQDIVITATVIYRLLYTLAKTKNTKFGDSIFNILKYIPSESLDFVAIYELFKLIYKEDESLIIYPLLLLKPNLFSNMSITFLKDIVYMLVGGILTTSVTKHQFFFLLPSYLLDTLSELRKPDQRKVAADIVQVLKSLPKETTAYLVSFLPIDPVAAEFTSYVGFSMVFHFFALELNDPCDVKNNFATMSQNIHKLKTLCQSGSVDEVLAASAIIALLEKLTVVEIGFKHLDKSKINRMTQELHMSFFTKNHTDLVALKEQLHFTRVQLDNLSDEYFGNESVEVNPWDS